MITPARSRVSYVALLLSPVAMLAVWSTRLLIAPIGRYAAAAVLIVAILTAAWMLGARFVTYDHTERRPLALVGTLLVTVWASLTFIGVLGSPDQATVQENKVRYVVLLIDAIAVTAAFMILRDILNAAGERFYSSLGFTAATLAGPAYITFTLVQQLQYRALGRAPGAQLPPGSELLDTLSVGLLFTAAALTYGATAAFAAALHQRQWLGKHGAQICIAISLFAVLCLGIRVNEALITADGPMWGFGHWYSLPGFIFSIPAVPWIIPSVLGIGLLRRVNAQNVSPKAA